MTGVLLLLLSLPLSAQTVSTDVVTSTAAPTAPPVDLSSTTAGGAPPAAAAPLPKAAPPPNPIRVKLHKEASSWEPVSVRQGGDALAARNAFSWRRKKKGKGAVGGKTSKAKSVARLYKAGDDARLVISVFPDKLAAQRTHLEVRLLVIEGYLEKAEVAAVTADEGAGPQDDAKQLEQKGIGYQEESPGSASLKISAIDARPSKGAVNAGTVSLAQFPESELNPKSLGLSSFEYSAKGLTDARKR